MEKLNSHPENIRGHYETRWYREPMLWLVVGIPLTAVVVGILFMTAAIVTWDGLVVDDYYKKGKEINQLLERDQRASDLGLSATLLYHDDSGLITVKVVSDQTSLSLPDVALTLRYVHRTRSGFDKSFTLEKVDETVYKGYGNPPFRGLWSIHLESPQWRLGARQQLPTLNDIVLVSKVPN